MKKIEENLKRNISELYKTAKTEIARKDRIIAELRTELDNLLFRRKNRYISDTDGKVEVTFGNKRSSIDVCADQHSSKRIKYEPISETSIKENDIPPHVKSDNNKDRLSRSRSNSVYSRHSGSVERDRYHSHIGNNKENVKNHKRDTSGSSKQEHTKSRSRSKEKDRFHNGKEKPRSRTRSRDRGRTRSRDRGRHYSSNRESSRRQSKSYKRDSDYYDKSSTRHFDKHHSRLKDENKSISERQDKNDKKVSESKQDKSCKNTSSSSKSSASFRKVNENTDNLKIEATKTGIITEPDTHKIASEKQNEIDRGQIIKNGDVDHIYHLENPDALNNKDVLLKLSESNFCKNQDVIIADNPHVNKDTSDIQLTNLDNNNSAVIPSSINEESVKSEENQNGRIIINVGDTFKNESETLDASYNDTINNSGVSTDVSPDTKGVNLGQNQSDKIKVSAGRRRRCVIKIVN